MTVFPSDTNDTAPATPASGVSGATRRGPLTVAPPIQTGKVATSPRTDSDVPTAQRHTFAAIVISVEDASPPIATLMRDNGSKIEAFYYGKHTDLTTGRPVLVTSVRDAGAEQVTAGELNPVKYVVASVDPEPIKIGMAKITSVPADDTEVLELEPDVTVDIKTATGLLEEHYRSVENPGGAIDLVFPNIGTHASPVYAELEQDTRVQVAEWTKNRWLVLASVGGASSSGSLVKATSGIPAFDEPSSTLGKEDCVIQVVDSDDGTFIAGDTVSVFNAGTEPVESGSYLVAVKDSGGNYIAKPSGEGGTSSGIFHGTAENIFDDTEASVNVLVTLSLLKEVTVGQTITALNYVGHSGNQGAECYVYYHGDGTGNADGTFSLLSARCPS